MQALQGLQERTRRALSELTPAQASAIALSGVIAGLVTLITSVSFAALMFSGPLTPFIANGISILVSTAVVAGSIYCIISGCRPVIAMPDDDTAPVLALMVALVVASFPAGTPPETLFIAAFVALAGAALLTGVILATLGVFRLGSLVRYLPYSVMGGYFAGAGLLLIVGALRVVTGLPLEGVAELPALFSGDQLLRWTPAVASAVLLRLAMGRLTEALVMPVGITVLICLFYLGALLFGAETSELMSNGWLAGPFPDANPTLINPVLILEATSVDWSVIVANLSSIGTIVMLSAVSLMLTASGLSVLQREDVDINRELRVAGATNTVSGLCGGLIALPSMGMTELAMSVGAPRSRWVGLAVALFCALALFFAMPLIAWFPKAVLAGLLMFLGWSLLERWLIQARTQLPRLEYAVVLMIVIVVAAVGFLEGVMVGLLSAIVLFVINYSRINVVRYALTGSQRRSNVERNPMEEAYLKENGSQTLILKLQGYLFFGTTAALAARIEGRLQDKTLPPLRFVALDFAQVTEMDSSAALSFMRLAQLAAKSNFFLLLTGMSPEMLERLMSNWFENETSSYVQILPDLDRGVEWCEERMLMQLETGGDNEGILEHLNRYLPSAEDRETLLRYVEHKYVEPGYVLAEQDAPSDEMFLLESCTASVYLDTGSGRKHRIRRAGAGTVFGEVGFYLGTPRTAHVIVDEAGDLYILTQADNERLEADYPHIAAALHKFMISVITRRLQLTTSTLQAVLT